MELSNGDMAIAIATFPLSWDGFEALMFRVRNLEVGNSSFTVSDELQSARALCSEGREEMNLFRTHG